MQSNPKQSIDPHASRQAKSVSATIVLALLYCPLVLSPLLISRNMAFIKNVENREATSLPFVNGIQDVLDTDTWDTFSAWWQERIPFRGDLIAAKLYVDKEWLGQRRLGGVDRGDDGWLFLRQSYGEHWHTPGQRVQDAIAALDAFLERNKEAPATFRVLLTPDKHTIYPEHLTEDGIRDVAGSLADRQELEQWFAATGDDRIIDLHAAMRSAKQTSEVELYLRDDTHQSWHGGAVMAKAIVNSIRPGTWADEHVVLDQTKFFHGDLRRLSAVSATPALEKQVLSVARPGVLPHRIHFEGDLVTDLKSIDSHPLSWQYPLRVEYQSTEGQPMVPGRTLILHDSCIGSIARPLIRPYFEDITFVHYTDASPEYLEDAMQTYDTVIVEIVERFAPEIFTSLMAPPNPGAPSRLWDRVDAQAAWILSAENTSSIQPDMDVTSRLDGETMFIHADASAAAIIIDNLALPEGQQHVLRAVYRASLPGDAAVQWAGIDGPEFDSIRQSTTTIRGGRNEIFLLLDNDEPIQKVRFQLGHRPGDYQVESIEIRSIPR